jgi:hypothetical protein
MRPPPIWLGSYMFVCLFITRSGRPALASVPDTINCRIIISEYVHVYIISSRCRHHRGATAAISIFLEWGYHSRRSPIQVLTVPMLLHFCTQNRGNRCFNIVRPLALEFGLLRMVRQPSADAHVIWVARHKVTWPQTILKFQPPSSLDYRTRHGSQSPGSYMGCLMEFYES